MTLAEARTILESNESATEGSFLYWLHEREKFDHASFWRLYNSGIIIGSATHQERGGFRRLAFHVYDGIMRHLLWHHSPHDQCQIEDMPGADLHEYLQCLSWALEPLIQGRPGRRRDAPHCLTNPYQSELVAHFRDLPDCNLPDTSQDS